MVRTSRAQMTWARTRRVALVPTHIQIHLFVAGEGVAVPERRTNVARVRTLYLFILSVERPRSDRFDRGHSNFSEKIPVGELVASDLDVAHAHADQRRVVARVGI